MAHKYSNRVLDTQDLTGEDDGYWIYLQYGWQLSDCHAIHEDTKKEAYARLFECVPCDCEDCRRHKEG